MLLCSGIAQLIPRSKALKSKVIGTNIRMRIMEPVTLAPKRLIQIRILYKKLRYEEQQALLRY